MVTKKDALERFINERVMGNRPCATILGNCTYDHSVHGGCEIGQYLPRGLASLANGNWKRVLESFPEVADYFEDPHSKFWAYLQMSHDSLSGLADFPKSITINGVFESSMRFLADETI